MQYDEKKLVAAYMIWFKVPICIFHAVYLITFMCYKMFLKLFFILKNIILDNFDVIILKI